MVKRIREKYYDRWAVLTAILLGLMMFMRMLELVFPQVHNISHFFFSRYAIILILASFFFFRGFKEHIEIKVLFIYSIWYLMTRFFNYGIHLPVEQLYGFYTRLFVIMFLFMTLSLSETRRSIAADILFSAVILIFTVLAAVSAWVYISQSPFCLGPSNNEIAQLLGKRVMLLGYNPNIIGDWFMVAAFLCLYMFIKHIKLYIRIPAVLAFAVNYLGILSAGSRNCQLGFSIGVSVIIIAYILGRLKTKSAGKKAAATIITAVIAVPILLGSFKATAAITGQLYILKEKIDIPVIFEEVQVDDDLGNENIDYNQEAESQVTEAEHKEKNDIPVISEEVQVDDAENIDYNQEAESQITEAEHIQRIKNKFNDDRTLFQDTGRLSLFKGAFITIQKEPFRLLIGSGDNMMTIANNYLRELAGRQDIEFNNYHNSFINVLLETGIPGLLIMLIFCVLLIRRMLLVFFSESEKAALEIKSLTGLLAAMFIYNLLEASIFSIHDIREILFFVVAGIFLSSSYEICPPKGKKI